MWTENLELTEPAQLSGAGKSQGSRLWNAEAFSSALLPSWVGPLDPRTMKTDSLWHMAFNGDVQGVCWAWSGRILTSLDKRMACDGWLAVKWLWVNHEICIRLQVLWSKDLIYYMCCKAPHYPHLQRSINSNNSNNNITVAFKRAFDKQRAKLITWCLWSAWWVKPLD